MEERAVPFFGGAKVTLGGVNITGKNFEDFMPYEIALLVMRYMIQNAKGNVYNGAVKYVLKKLWPNDIDEPSPKLMRAIYRYLKTHGFRHLKGIEDRWLINPYYLETMGAKEKIVVVRNVEPSPVSYRCGLCDEGPWTNRSEYLEHFSLRHKEGVMVESGKFACPDCGKEFDSATSLRAHRTHHAPGAEDKKKRLVECPRCGKLVRSRGMGGHVASHKESKQGRELLALIKEKEGLHPREYAELLNTTGTVISARAATLRAHGRIKVIGNRQNARYFLETRKRSGRSFRPKPSVEAPEPIKAIATIPEGIKQIIGAENVQIFETKDGKTYIFKDGELFLLSLAKVG